MVDNVAITPGAGATVATDDVGGLHYQRVKQAFGPDGTATDVSATNPLPAGTPSATATGNITAANATPDTGAGTAGSSVVLTVPDGHASWTITLGGTFSAGTTVGFQCSIDGTNWYWTNGRRNLNTLGANEGQSLVSTDVVGGAPPNGGNPSLWKGTTGAVRYVRVTASTFTGGDSVAVSILSSAGTGGTFQLGSIPAGTSTIGAVKNAPAATATLTSTAGTVTSTTVLAANTNRIGASLHATTGSATVYVRLGGGTATSALGGHTFDMNAGGYYELPDGFTGAVSAVWASAAGGLNVTEWV